MTKELDVEAMLLRAERKALNKLENYRKATASPDYRQRVEALEEAYATACAVRRTWQEHERRAAVVDEEQVSSQKKANYFLNHRAIEAEASLRCRCGHRKDHHDRHGNAPCRVLEHGDQNCGCTAFVLETQSAPPCTKCGHDKENHTGTGCTHQVFETRDAKEGGGFVMARNCGCPQYLCAIKIDLVAGTAHDQNGKCLVQPCSEHPERGGG